MRSMINQAIKIFLKSSLSLPHLSVITSAFKTAFLLLRLSNKCVYFLRIHISPSLQTNKPLFSTEAPTCYITVTIPEWREVFRRHLAAERSRSQIFRSQIYPDRQQKYRILEMIPPRVLLWWIKRFFFIRGAKF